MLKIDRSFVSGLAEDPDDVAIVRAMHPITRDGGVAEGIETRPQLQLGCAKGQGYVFNRPLSSHDAEGLLEPVTVPAARPAPDAHPASADHSVGELLSGSSRDTSPSRSQEP